MLAALGEGSPNAECAWALITASAARASCQPVTTISAPTAIRLERTAGLERTTITLSK
jgi:hypothetical protein